MAYEQRDNSGSFFKNTKKETERHPDYTGSAKVAGVDYWASVWVKESAAGRKFFSIAFTPKDDGAVSEKKASASLADDDRITTGKPPLDDMNDDIPF